MNYKNMITKNSSYTFKVPQKFKNWYSLFLNACKSGDSEVIRQLCTPELKSIADIHSYNNAGFIWACRNGHLEIVKFLTTSAELIAAGHTFVDIHADDEAGFHAACDNGYLDIVKFLCTSQELFKAGHTFVDIHTENEKGFRQACSKGHLDIVKLLTTSSDLLKSGHTLVDIYEEIEIGFQLACLNSQWEVMRFLIFELNMKLTPKIQKTIEKYPQAQECFRVRKEQEQLAESLNSRLSSSSNLAKKSEIRL